ncbi:ParB/RepB/Spo0J family partition protein [bacterium D16-51]|nr:ParB/RepB/Spo0J family partition protein [bacterium D16-59]RKI60391.1 ParB/RepB/Spo0J family partition protein [bacterium D16-51]
MAGKRGLGAGIDTLIPKRQESDSNIKTEVKTIVKEVDTIDINKIEPNHSQPRKNFNEDALQELADSIKQHGMIEPLIVQQGEKGFYRIIAGERRWRAAKIAGIKEIPVIVKDYSNREIMEIALIENIQREDLNPIEEAEAFQRLIEEYHLKQDEVAEKVSKSRVAITNALRLLKLDEKVRQMVIEDKIKSGHARALLAIEDLDLQYDTAVKVFDEKLSVRETEKLVKNLLKGDKKREEKKLAVDEQLEIVYAEYAEKLKSIMGTKVNINRNKDGKKGKIEIEYYSSEEFERIMDMMSHLQ